MYRGSGHCSSLKNKDNLKDGWENLIPLLEKMRLIPSSGTPQGRGRGYLRGQTRPIAWGTSVRGFMGTAFLLHSQENHRQAVLEGLGLEP